MAYYIDLYSPETYQAFTDSDRSTTGFKVRHKAIAESIKPGDRFICYVTKISRWVGFCEVTSDYFINDDPIFATDSDPYIIRFNIVTKVWLTLEEAIPIYDNTCWNHLSFTKNLAKNSPGWTGMVRSSLRKLEDEDGMYLEGLLLNQMAQPTIYPLGEVDKRKIKSLKVKTQDNKEVAVSIPENEEASTADVVQPPTTQRDSIIIQGRLAEIGERMNLKIWIPRSDRQRVLEVWEPHTKCLLEHLPLNYDDVTLKTIENIDVLWIRGRSIVRAFEVEHTTSIYSGILRMADLMALQPNLNIRAHIVAPIDRKEKVLQEISRPVFALLEKGPLSESCTFISYESIQELSKEKRLEYMTDAVLEEYADYAEEADL